MTDISKLKIDCSKCSGLCCTALNYFKCDGFPENKKEGKPCKNLTPDFSCAIHSQLFKKQLRGCMAYDCFGAGQMITQYYFENTCEKGEGKEIFSAFLKLFRLNHTMWYLLCAVDVPQFAGLHLTELILENEHIRANLLDFGAEEHLAKAAGFLKESIMSFYGTTACTDCIGTSFHKAALNDTNFSMCLLLGADFDGCSLNGSCFLGADMRGAIIKNADLSHALFLTQMQINSAIGDSCTLLPHYITRPSHWMA